MCVLLVFSSVCHCIRTMDAQLNSSMKMRADIYVRSVSVFFYLPLYKKNLLTVYDI